MTNGLVSIIIPTYNKIDMTITCINSIIKYTQGIEYEIIVGDDCSTESTDKIKYMYNTQIVKTYSNVGFLLNCNNAAKFSKGEFLVFLNNDTEVTKDWLLPMIDLFEKDPLIGIVGSKLLNTNGTLQEAGGIVFKNGAAWNYGRNSDPLHPEFNYVKETDYVSGACLMIRKSLWDSLEGFNPIYAPAYCEDTDLSFRVRKKGYKVVYQPASVVYHHEGKSHGKNINEGIKKYQSINNTKFRHIWAETLATHTDESNVFLQRDRNFNKSIMLIVDHYIPSFDEDAGSKTLYQYIKTFLSMGMTIKLVGANFAQKYQVQRHCEAFEQLGVEVLYGPKYNPSTFESWLKFHGKYLSFVLLSRPNIAINFLSNIKKYAPQSIILYYGHDLHHLREYRKYEIDKNPSTLRESERLRDIEFKVMKSVDYVFSINDHEYKIINSQIHDSKIIRIPPYVYFNKNKYIKNFKDRNNLFFIGGFRHTPNVDAVLWFVNTAWESIQAYNKNIKFLIAGSHMPLHIKTLHNTKNIEILGQVSEEELTEIYNSIRLVVAPIRYGAGVKGKVVDSLYRGLPIVSTTIGLEGLQNIESIYSAYDTDKDFSNRIIEIYDDYKLLEKLSKNSIDYIDSYFSFDVAKDIFKSVLISKNIVSNELLKSILAIRNIPKPPFDPLNMKFIGILNINGKVSEEYINSVLSVLNKYNCIVNEFNDLSAIKSSGIEDSILCDYFIIPSTNGIEVTVAELLNIPFTIQGKILNTQSDFFIPKNINDEDITRRIRSLMNYVK